GGRGGAVWLEPLPVNMKQRGLFLRAGNRDSEIIISGKTERGLRQIREELFDGFLVNRLSRNGRGVSRRLSVTGNELQRTDAIPADCRQQAIRIIPKGSYSVSYTLSHGVGV